MKKKIDVGRAKDGIRVGFESMEYYHSPREEDAKKELLRFYFKGRVVKFVIAKRTHHEIDGVRGIRLDLITDSPRANIWYEAFERADGIVFFLGESETQSVAEETRNLAYRSLDRWS